MSSRVYPTNAPRGAGYVLIGNGDPADVFPFPEPCEIAIQNNTASTITFYDGDDATLVATAGDEVALVNRLVLGLERATFISVYGPPGTVINGTAPNGVVIYGIAT